MKYYKKLGIALLIGGILFTACSEPSKNINKNGAVDEATQKELDEISKQVSAYKDIVSLSKAETIDLIKLAEKYDLLVSTIEEVNKVLPGYKDEMDGYIKKAKEDEEFRVGYIRGLDTGIQRGFVTKIIEHIEHLNKSTDKFDNSLSEYYKVMGYYELIDINSINVGKIFFKSEDFEYKEFSEYEEFESPGVKTEERFSIQFDLMFKEIKRGIDDRDSKMVKAVTEEVKILIEKLYFLATIHETDELIELKGKGNSKKLFEKKIAGLNYYKILESWIENKELSKVILDEYKKEIKELDPVKIKKDVKLVFPNFTKEFEHEIED